jgi:predicted signal transduction protein with EAL and GGDEF domain
VWQGNRTRSSIDWRRADTRRRIESEDIIDRADLAMYRAKGQGCSSVVFFEPTRSGPLPITNAQKPSSV